MVKAVAVAALMIRRRTRQFRSTQITSGALEGKLNWCTAELLRTWGEARRGGEPTETRAEAEAIFLKALDLARQQGAFARELRIVTSLARLWSLDGQRLRARDLLAGAYEKMVGAASQPDVKRALSLLAELA
jgi:hypothetical protein